MKRPRAGRGRSRPVNRNGSVIGLDLGATSIRAATLSLGSNEGRPSIIGHGMGTVALPPGAIVNGAVIEQAVVTEALKRLWASHDFNGKRVILGVANPQAVVRPLKIPNLNAQQRAKALPFQAKEIIALPLDQVVLDYVQLGEPHPETGLVSGLLIATPRLPVLAAVEAVERAGLTVGRVDLSSFGALRAIGDEHLAVQAVIDFGAHLTSIVIHNQGIPQLVRTLARGGQELTDLLADNLNVSGGEAEMVKCETGLTGHTDSAAETLQAAIRPLMAEIRSSINYFRAGSDNAPLEGISLTGGGSALPGLAAALERQHGVPAAVVGAMHHVLEHKTGNAGAGVGSDRAASAVAIGLAMGAAA